MTANEFVGVFDPGPNARRVQLPNGGYGYVIVPDRPHPGPNDALFDEDGHLRLDDLEADGWVVMGALHED